MPCLLKRNNGVYYVVSSKRKKRVWKSLHTSDGSAAQIMFDKLSGQEKIVNGLTLSTLWLELQPIIESNVSASTAQLYRQVHANLKKVVGDKRAKEISVYDIERYKLVRSKTIQKITVNKELRTVRAFLNNAQRLGFIKENPAAQAPNFRIPTKPPVFMSPNEVMVLIKCIDSSEMRDIVYCALLTAMRLGEIVNLEWSDIDFLKKIIWIRNKAGFRAKGGKERIIPLCDSLSLILNEKRRNGNTVFFNRFGNQFKVGNVSRRFKGYVRKAGLSEQLHFHSLRHTSISWMHENGIPSEYIRQIAGHSSIMVTHIYTHASPSHLYAATNSLNLQLALIKGNQIANNFSTMGK